jgi:hypothetical protein
MEGDFDNTLAALAVARTGLKKLEEEKASIQAKLAEIEKEKAKTEAEIGVLVTKLQLTQAKPEPVAKPTPVAKPEPMQKPKSFKEIQAEQAKAEQANAKPTEPTPQTNPDQTLPRVRFHKCNPCDVDGCAAPWTHETYLHNVREKEACKKCDEFGSWKKRTDHLSEWCTTAALQQCALCVKRGRTDVHWTQEQCYSHKYNV